jgi:hypothetical protein
MNFNNSNYRLFPVLTRHIMLLIRGIIPSQKTSTSLFIILSSLPLSPFEVSLRGFLIYGRKTFFAQEKRPLPTAPLMPLLMRT